VKGIMLLNTGDYNLPTDLLARLIEWKMKREWHDGHFRSLDFVSCATVDLVRRGQNPFHSRHIVRSLADELVVDATRFVFASGYNTTQPRWAWRCRRMSN
jgi:hypothetical protein